MINVWNNYDEFSLIFLYKRFVLVFFLVSCNIIVVYGIYLRINWNCFIKYWKYMIVMFNSFFKIKIFFILFII